MGGLISLAVGTGQTGSQRLITVEATPGKSWSAIGSMDDLLPSRPLLWDADVLLS